MREECYTHCIISTRDISISDKFRICTDYIGLVCNCHRLDKGREGKL